MRTLRARPKRARLASASRLERAVGHMHGQHAPEPRRAGARILTLALSIYMYMYAYDTYKVTG